ncbi:histidine kinase dimerization/phospho-acceptor domain-containing protein [Nitrosopumilus sp.]|uniref:histidine kinase dimerization/phospho-acceptor domain-containing protein n=1 Tax=Nitrosopumilus sp. TaxID=2024843 RepID=UPI0034A00EA1
MDDHIINELQQIILFQKKLEQIINSDEQDKSRQIPDLIDNLESTNILTEKLVSDILSDKTKFDKEFLSILNHELRTPLVPIKTYSEMLMQNKFGKLNEQQKEKLDIIITNTNLLQQKIMDLLKQNADKISSDKEYRHHLKEIEQEKVLLERLNDLLNDEIKQDKKTVHELQDTVTKLNQNQKEYRQEEWFLDKLVKDEEKKNNLLAKKNLIIIAISAIIVSAGFVAYSTYVVSVVGSQYKIINIGDMRSGYVIQNLRGDTIDTWLSWRLVEGTTIDVNLLDGEKYPDMAEIVRKVLLSEESIEIDNSLLHKGLKGTTSTYYVGWAGALGSIDNPTEFYIPKKFNLIESAKGEGAITIRLTPLSNGDGYSGYTKSIADDAQNQILKSEITIYEIDKLSKAQFETILRHELGHALGLAHSTAAEDLMHPTIETNYPYISDCNIDAIILLYDGGKKSEVTCEI